MDDKNAIQTTMSALINDVRGIVESGLKKAYQNVNAITVFTYWQVGKRIVEEEQQGEKRAEYGAQIFNMLSADLCRTYAKGYTPRDLQLKHDVAHEFGLNHHKLLSSKLNFFDYLFQQTKFGTFIFLLYICSVKVSTITKEQ